MEERRASQGSDLSRLAEGFDTDTATKLYAPSNAIARWVGGPAALAIDDDPTVLRDAHPAQHARADAPPFLLFHGSDDLLVSQVQTAILHRALLEAGANSHRILVRGAGHGDLAVRSGEDRYWTTEIMMQRITAFLHEQLA